MIHKKILTTILIYISLITFNINYNTSLYAKNLDKCKWEIQDKIPCIEIKKYISNTSKFAKSNSNRVLFTKKEIQEIGAIDLIDILKFVPGVNITQSGPKGQQASIFMNGTGSNHTLVMINGVPINDQSTTQGLHDFGVDFLQTVQQIEIYPGSSAVNFGANSIGGVVNIILTADYKDSVSFSKDKNSNYEFSGNKTFVYDDSSLNVKLGNVKNKSISASGNISDEKDALNNYTSNINYEKFINDNVRIYNTTYLRQTKAEYDNSNVNQIGYEGDNKMGSFQFGLERQQDSQKNNYIFYYNIYDREYDERGTIDTYKSQVLGLKYDISKLVNQKFSFGLGSEYKYDWGNFNNKGSYEASTKGNSDNLAIYGNLGFNFFQNSNISFFARSDKHKYAGKNNSYKLNFDQKFANFNFGASYMNSMRNPTIYEMFGTDNYGYSGNINLKPEKSNTYEIYSNIIFNEILNLSLRAFRANIKDNIEYKDNKYQNDADNIDLNQSGFNNQLKIKLKNKSINLFSSFLSSKKENNSDQLRRPEKNYGLNFKSKINNNFFGDLEFNLMYNHYGKHFDTHSSNFSTIELDSTDLIDLKISKKLFNSNLFVKISNLLNENYQRPHGYNQDNRLIRFGINY